MTRPPHPTSWTRETAALHRAVDDLTRIAAGFDHHVSHVVAALKGQPGAQNLDGDQVGGGDNSDSTGDTACDSDHAAADLLKVRRLIKHAEQAAADLVLILGRYQPRPANLYEATTTADGDPGCQSCSRLHNAQGAKRWEPVYRAVLIGDERVPLCRWCRDWFQANGSIPTRELLERHHRGERIRRPA